MLALDDAEGKNANDDGREHNRFECVDRAYLRDWNREQRRRDEYEQDHS